MKKQDGRVNSARNLFKPRTEGFIVEITNHDTKPATFGFKGTFVTLRPGQSLRPTALLELKTVRRINASDFSVVDTEGETFYFPSRKSSKIAVTEFVGLRLQKSTANRYRALAKVEGKTLSQVLRERIEDVEDFI